MEASDALQRRFDELLAATGGHGAQGAFSPFLGDGGARAADLAAELGEVARGEGLEAALEKAAEAAGTQPPGLVKLALSLFVTHEPVAAGRLALPVVEAVETLPIEDRPPRRPPPGGALPPGIPGAPPRREREDDGGEGPLEAAPPPTDMPPGWDAQVEPSLTEPPAERALDWYREDPFANDHHAHWHRVYRREGIGRPRRTQRRHGELFFYMHQQMLARYDTERVIAGLGRVAAHPPRDAQKRPDYEASIPEGYGSPGYRLRKPGHSFSEADGAVERLRAVHAALTDAIAAKRLDLGADLGPLDESQLGAAAEVGTLSTANRLVDVEQVAARYGNLHGSGHGLVGDFGTGEDPNGWGGAMLWTETAICDPFFYRWHKHVDDVYAQFQDDSKELNEPAEHAPADVAFGGGRSIALCLSRDIPGATEPGFDFDAFARERLGPDLGGDDALLTSELPTRFVRSRVTAGIPQATQRVTYWTTHLEHEPFTWFVRLENASGQPRAVTVRAFLAHADLAHDRRAWVELDKLVGTLQPGVNVLGRPDARSTVIKRRGVTAPGVEPLPHDAADLWCDCGWPYSLLLPSGASTAEGTPFRLMLAVTDHERDLEPAHQRTCGSMSWCGALENYPDRRRMGYPFDRPFSAGIEETIAAEPSMTAIDVTIRCENARPPE